MDCLTCLGMESTKQSVLTFMNHHTALYKQVDRIPVDCGVAFVFFWMSRPSQLSQSRSTKAQKWEVEVDGGIEMMYYLWQSTKAGRRFATSGFFWIKPWDVFPV